jgi:hypothetical protein
MLRAIARSDNGKRIGMQAILGRSYLKYKAFKGKLELQFEGKFDIKKITEEPKRRTFGYLDGLAIYRIANGKYFVSLNAGHVF